MDPLNRCDLVANPNGRPQTCANPSSGRERTEMTKSCSGPGHGRAEYSSALCGAGAPGRVSASPRRQTPGVVSAAPPRRELASARQSTKVSICSSVASSKESPVTAMNIFLSSSSIG
jgi:hypothetical protein